LILLTFSKETSKITIKISLTSLIRSTNPAAESFNAKGKYFRRQFRGVVDVKFFLFRLIKIFA